MIRLKQIHPLRVITRQIHCQWPVLRRRFFPIDSNKSMGRIDSIPQLVISRTVVRAILRPPVEWSKHIGKGLHECQVFWNQVRWHRGLGGRHWCCGKSQGHVVRRYVHDAEDIGDEKDDNDEAIESEETAPSLGARMGVVCVVGVDAGVRAGAEGQVGFLHGW